MDIVVVSGHLIQHSKKGLCMASCLFCPGNIKIQSASFTGNKMLYFFPAMPADPPTSFARLASSPPMSHHLQFKSNRQNFHEQHAGNTLAFSVLADE